MDTTADIGAHPDYLANVIAERNAYKGKSLARGKLLERFRDEVHNICDNATDEGDRAYFGSTNDLDTLREIVREMEAWKWDAVMKERPLADPYAECREQRARAESAERERDTHRELIATLCRALEPFANAVFNDNGDMTVDLCFAKSEDFIRAYFARKSASISEKGDE